MYKTGIDWIRYTAPYGTNFDAILPSYVFPGGKIEPLPYYNNAIELAPCGRLDWNSQNRKQGIMVTFSGSDLRTFDALETEPAKVLGELHGSSLVKYTRVDLAVDISEVYVSPDDLLDSFKAGRAKTRVRAVNQIRGFDKAMNRTGNTVQFGNRTSETFMRCYDKALETIVKNKVKEKELVNELRQLDYKRVELELKGGKANLAAKGVVFAGIGQTIRATLNQYIDFPDVAWWGDMLASLPDAENGLMVGGRKSKGDSQEWLHKQALPAIIKAIGKTDWFVIDCVDGALSEVDIVANNPRQLRLFD